MLCDNGWRLPGVARIFPNIPADIPIDSGQWRVLAEFEVVSAELGGRVEAVQQLLIDLDGSPRPLFNEWSKTIDRLAKAVREGDLEATWDAFLRSVVQALPAEMRSSSTRQNDPLAATRFLPTQDGRLISGADSAALFFQPVRGVDDAAELVGEVPEALLQRVAFLHPDVVTQEGQQRRNTPVQKFLDERFARGFRREDLLRDVVLTSLPKLPAAHGTRDAEVCSQLLAWALKLIGEEEPESLLPLIRRLPVACHGGWYVIQEAVFGPGWDGRSGDLIWILAEGMPEGLKQRIRSPAVLPPDDQRWATSVTGRAGLLSRAGVSEGLRLRTAADIHFHMQGYGNHELPETPPPDIPQEAWNSWRHDVRSEAEPGYEGQFKYALLRTWVLPELHQISLLSPSALDAFWRLVLASLKYWPKGWGAITIKKMEGNAWSRQITSPLKYWLQTMPWLRDRRGDERTIGQRWLVPDTFLPGQRERFAHLNPLSDKLARRLQNDPELKSELLGLGLNNYPVEDETVGPELLQALAEAWVARRIPPGRFDIFLGQVREAWRHLDLDEGIPTKLLVRTGRRAFTVCDPDELVDVYLPDNRERTRALHEHGKRILEMQAADAIRVGRLLTEQTLVRRAATLEERVIVDGERWTGLVEGIPALEDTGFEWLPSVLLSIAAHGGTRPVGANTDAWQNAASRLRRARVLECESIEVQLIDEERVVASSEPDARWLSGDVLAIRRSTARSYENLAVAAQAMLDRQDLVKDLRLVLGVLSGQERPTADQIEFALERAEIDSQAVADIRHRWLGSISVIADRIRPVLVLLEVSTQGFEAAAADIEHLTEWLSEHIEKWPANELLHAARRSRDDAAMGREACRVLGEVAQLPQWNGALTQAGDRYAAVQNRRVDEQVVTHLEQAARYLRAFSRYIAVKIGEPKLFHELEGVAHNFSTPAEWAGLWWEVPFQAVVDKLRSEYENNQQAGAYLDMLNEVGSVVELKAKFEAGGIEVDPNPYEIASKNQEAFGTMVLYLEDLRQAWEELRGILAATPEAAGYTGKLDPAAYLNIWPEDELIQRALSAIGDTEFAAACEDCKSVEEIRGRLRVDPAVVESRRKERFQREQEEERKRRTVDVAGTPFELGASSYQKLFDRLDQLAAPQGPNASADAFTPLEDAHKKKGGGGGGGTGGKSSHRRLSPELRDLVGVVGEMRAFRYLREEFGSDVVSRDAWVSELRWKAMPPVPGEPDITSDSYGYDFQFRHGGRQWHVEVKASQGDDSQFDLGITEIEAASRLAGDPKRPWRILRVQNALQDQPTFEWLPNPFEEGFRQKFQLNKAGMRVSYVLKKS